MLSTMNRIKVQKVEKQSALPSVENKAVPEDLKSLFEHESNSALKEEVELLHQDAMARRKFFARRDKLDAVKLSPDHVFTMDFCNGCQCCSLSLFPWHLLRMT